MYKDTGIIKTLRDGIAEISGLQKVQAGELVMSSVGNNMGLVLNLLHQKIGVVFLSENNLKVGSLILRTYELINVPVGIFLLDSVINALGLNMYIKNFKSKKIFVQLDSVTRSIELKAPGIIERQSVYESLYTGSKIIDGIVPIGRGQRELIIGDRQTGKTALVIDTMLLTRSSLIDVK